MEISFENLIFDDKTPVYYQIIKFIKANILLGNLKDGEILPSRRSLAVFLNVNPNTIQKTYRQLEEEGVIITPNNANSILCVNDRTLAEIHNSLVKQEVSDFIKFIKSLNLSYKDMLDLISNLWDKA